jgi:hypothetical protein
MAGVEMVMLADAGFGHAVRDLETKECSLILMPQPTPFVVYKIVPFFPTA